MALQARPHPIHAAGDLRPGVAVRLTGLVGAVELNGRVGRICRRLPESGGRWEALGRAPRGRVRFPWGSPPQRSGAVARRHSETDRPPTMRPDQAREWRGGGRPGAEAAAPGEGQANLAISHPPEKLPDRGRGLPPSASSN